MKKKKVNLLEEMAKRVYRYIALEQILGFNKGKPLMDKFQISEHIRANLDKYLSKEEITQLVSDNTFCKDNEEMKSMVMYIAIELVGENVRQAIDNAMNKNYGGHSQFPPMKDLQLSIIEKFYNVMGGKLW